MFSVVERLLMIQKSANRLSNVQIDSFESQLLVNYAQSVEARFILRGIRSTNDFTYEQGMRNINADINPKIDTVFLLPPRELAEVSSSLVKGLIGPEGWEYLIHKYVPQPVFEKIVELKKVKK